MKKRRKHCTPEEKVAILRRHLVEGAPLSDLGDESGLQPLCPLLGAPHISSLWGILKTPRNNGSRGALAVE